MIEINIEPPTRPCIDWHREHQDKLHSDLHLNIMRINPFSQEFIVFIVIENAF